MYRALALAIVTAVAAAGGGLPVEAQSADGKDRRVLVVNQRSTDMLRLYGARTTTDSWEENILLTPIPSGGKRVINFDDGTGACQFDLRAIFRDNVPVHMWNINVCRESYWVVVDD
jgi:hypothetical protein